MEWARIRYVIGKRNTQRTDEKLGTNQEKKTVGKYMRVYLQYILLQFCHNITNLNTYEFFIMYTKH